MAEEDRKLALPDHGVKTKHGPQGPLVFDALRGRWVALTPEEWVRQHFINHLVHDLGYPAGRIAVEQALVLNSLSKRADVVVYGNDGSPVALVECKAPMVAISQRTFEQAARYNKVFRVAHLLVTNGLRHYACRVDHHTGAVDFLPRLPAYSELSAGAPA